MKLHAHSNLATELESRRDASPLRLPARIFVGGTAESRGARRAVRVGGTSSGRRGGDAGAAPPGADLHRRRGGETGSLAAARACE
jgi:hypothetical protein